MIVQMIADKVPGKNLVPTTGTVERRRAQEWLSFVGTELHKNFSPLFNPAIPDDVSSSSRTASRASSPTSTARLPGKIT